MDRRTQGIYFLYRQTFLPFIFLCHNDKIPAYLINVKNFRNGEYKPMGNKADRYQRTYPISWDQLHRDAKALAWRLHGGEKNYRGIVAVTRGGLVPAAIIARELGVYYIDTVCITSYNWKEQGRASILKAIDDTGEGLLIIDDLVDTGKTGKLVREMLPKAYFATVYAKPAGVPVVDAFITEVSQDTWILFPWDSESQFVAPISDK